MSVRPAAQVVVAEAAVVRMAGAAAVPAGAPALEHDLLRGVPHDRWDADAATLARNAVRFSGFLDGGARCRSRSPDPVSWQPGSVYGCAIASFAAQRLASDALASGETMLA